MFIWVNFFQTELMVEICSKSLVRATCGPTPRTPIKTHKGVKFYPYKKGGGWIFF